MDTDLLIGSILTNLNNTSILTDPFNGTRIGSFVFGPDQELNFNKYMPKGHIDFNSKEHENKSYGRAFLMDGVHIIDITFFTRKGDVGSGTTKKNVSLVLNYIDLIGSAIRQNNIVGFSLADIGIVESINYNPTNGIYFGTLPVVYRERS